MKKKIARIESKEILGKETEKLLSHMMYPSVGYSIGKDDIIAFLNDVRDYCSSKDDEEKDYIDRDTIQENIDDIRACLDEIENES